MVSYGGILMRENSRGVVEILLRKPTGHYDGYLWTFAKGQPDPGETPQETALRETLEETGYLGKILGKISGSFSSGSSMSEYFLMIPAKHIPSEMGWETSEIAWSTFPEARDRLSESTNELGRARDLAVLEAAYKAYQSLLRANNVILAKLNSGVL